MYLIYLSQNNARIQKPSDYATLTEQFTLFLSCSYPTVQFFTFTYLSYLTAHIGVAHIHSELPVLRHLFELFIHFLRCSYYVLELRIFILSYQYYVTYLSYLYTFWAAHIMYLSCSYSFWTTTSIAWAIHVLPELLTRMGSPAHS